MEVPSSVHPSLQVFLGSQCIFSSYGNWLYPLFDLQDFLHSHPVDMSQVKVHDKVIGKAAAFLIVRLQAGRVHGDLMSDLAIQVFTDQLLPYSFNKRVDRIDCQTEEILVNIDQIDMAYEILCEKANRC